MRPKFRAWDKEKNKMFEPTYRAYAGELEELLISLKGDLILRKIDETIHESLFPDRFVLMQYTGLKDRNGVEVYINDIAEDEYGHRYEIVFEGDCLRCNGVRRVRGGHKPKNRWFSKDLEIIGNVYETPELLEEQNK